MLKIAVCDDSPLFLELAIKFINKWSEERQFPVSISSYNNGDDLLAANADERMDIIFLDIIMPLLNGMDTARELRQTDKAVKIIFLTSSPEFALESYEVKAQGYVLKPIVYEQLKDMLDECAHAITHMLLPMNLHISSSKLLLVIRSYIFMTLNMPKHRIKKLFFTFAQATHWKHPSLFIHLKADLQKIIVSSSATEVIWYICRM